MLQHHLSNDRVKPAVGVSLQRRFDCRGHDCEAGTSCDARGGVGHFDAVEVSPTEVVQSIERLAVAAAKLQQTTFRNKPREEITAGAPTGHARNSAAESSAKTIRDMRARSVFVSKLSREIAAVPTPPTFSQPVCAFWNLH